MRLTRAIKKKKGPAAGPNLRNLKEDSSGVALFMVISAVSILAILVTEFTYIAQISQSIAFGGLDQLKAHYVAKSGFKLSLLRLKAYQQVKKIVKDMGGAAGAVPKSIMEKIWNFPIVFPIPTNIPGLSAGDKAAIDKFQKESNLEGSFSSNIASESSKYNLNMLLAGYVPAPNPSASASDSPKPGPSDTPNGNTANNTPNPNPNPSPTFDAAAQRDSLQSFLGTILTQKFEEDPDFAANYRDFRLEDFIDSVAGWADRLYDRRTSSSHDKILMKRAPFYSISELHMLPMMDDELYNLFAPNLTVDPTPGININSMNEATLHSLVPQMTKDELKAFFKYRDSEEADNMFADETKFFEYLQKTVNAFSNNAQAITNLKDSLAKRSVYLVTEETQFRVTVRAQVGNSVRIIDANVTLMDNATGGSDGSSKGKSGDNDGNAPNPTPSANPIDPNTGTPAPPSSGLKITFMRIY